MAEKKINFLDKTESILKLLGTAVTVIVIFGYPAIYFHLKSFDLPFHVITYKNVFYAGIIPAIIFAFFFVSGYWVYKQFKNKTGIKSIIFVAAIGAPVFLIEYLGLIFMMLYGMWWLYSRILVLFGVDVTKIGLINFTFISMVAIIVGAVIHVLFPDFFEAIGKFGQRKFKRFYDRYLSKYMVMESEKDNLIEKEKEIKEAKEETVEEKTENGSDRKSSDGWLILGGSIGIIVFVYLGYLSVIWIIQTRFPTLFSNFDSFKNIFFKLSIFLAVVVVFSLVISNIKKHAIARNVFLFVYGVAFIILVFFYSTRWFSKIDIRLGGGKPVPVNIWIKTTDFPKEILLRYRQTTIIDTSGYTHWENGLLIMENDKDIVISNKDSVWTIIPKEKILAFEKVRGY